jgi:hypothetical protein
LYPSSLDENLLQRLLVSTQTSGFVCTHSGFPWLRKIADVGFAANCGVVGKPDHDGDPAVHYLIMDTTGNSVKLELRRVTYDYESWANQLRREGVSEIFIQPLITGTWTVGIESLPPAERKLNRRPDAGGTILEWAKSSRPRASADTKSFGHGAPVGGT